MEIISVTVKAVKVSENDYEISLCGPFGGIHNIDVHGNINGDLVQTLKVDDYVDFRAIQLLAIAICKNSKCTQLLIGLGDLITRSVELVCLVGGNRSYNISSS